MSNGIPASVLRKHFKKVIKTKEEDCVSLALSLAFDMSEDKALEELVFFKAKYNISEDILNEKVWGNFLIENGYQIEYPTEIISLMDIFNSPEYNKDRKIIARACEHLIYITGDYFYDHNLISNLKREILYLYIK